MCPNLLKCQQRGEMRTQKTNFARITLFAFFLNFVSLGIKKKKKRKKDLCLFLKIFFCAVCFNNQNKYNSTLLYLIMSHVDI